MSKHPDTDHRRQLEMLAEAVARTPGASLRTVGCLDLCRSSNVIAVRDDRRRVRVNLWFAEVNGPAATSEICRWLTTPGLPPPTRGRFEPRRAFPEDPSPSRAPAP